MTGEDARLSAHIYNKRRYCKNSDNYRDPANTAEVVGVQPPGTEKGAPQLKAAKTIKQDVATEREKKKAKKIIESFHIDKGII